MKPREKSGPDFRNGLFKDGHRGRQVDVTDARCIKDHALFLDVRIQREHVQQKRPAAAVLRQAARARAEGQQVSLDGSKQPKHSA